jgi:hypothetical protein
MSRSFSTDLANLGNTSAGATFGKFTFDVTARTVTLSTGRIVPVQWIGEQHVREDLGFIPSFADWVKAIRPEPWMGRALRLSDRLEITIQTD